MNADKQRCSADICVPFCRSDCAFAMTTNKQVLLANRPSGWVKESDFRIAEQPLAGPRDGEVLVRNLFLSLDPYMRGRMNAAKSYAANVELGAVMVGGTVGEVMESRNP